MSAVLLLCILCVTEREMDEVTVSHQGRCHFVCGYDGVLSTAV